MYVYAQYEILLASFHWKRFASFIIFFSIENVTWLLGNVRT